MNENLESLLKLYRADKATEYVVEREFAKFIGDRTGVRILSDSNNTNTSYVAFVIPEKHVEGFYTTIIFDKKALFTLYSDDEIIRILTQLKEKKYNFTKKYNDFLLDKAGNTVSFSEVMGFLLSLYSTYRNDLSFKSNEFLPDEDEILKIADKYNMGDATQEDTENLLVKHYISYPIIAFVEKYVKESMKINLDPEIPHMNELGNIIGAECRNQGFVPFGHAEIPYDYKSPHNQ